MANARKVIFFFQSPQTRKSQKQQWKKDINIYSLVKNQFFLIRQQRLTKNSKFSKAGYLFVIKQYTNNQIAPQNILSFIYLTSFFSISFSLFLPWIPNKMKRIASNGKFTTDKLRKDLQNFDTQFLKITVKPATVSTLAVNSNDLSLTTTVITTTMNYAKKIKNKFYPFIVSDTLFMQNIADSKQNSKIVIKNTTFCYLLLPSFLKLSATCQHPSLTQQLRKKAHKYATQRRPFDCMSQVYVQRHKNTPIIFEQVLSIKNKTSFSFMNMMRAANILIRKTENRDALMMAEIKTKGVETKQSQMEVMMQPKEIESIDNQLIVIKDGKEDNFEC